MGVSLKEIALRVNTSVASVSNALNNTGKLSDAKRAEILKVAKEMGYEPNFMAKSLKTNKTNTVCVITFEFGNFYGLVIDEIAGILRQSGYDIVVCDEHTFYKMKKGVFDAVIIAHHDYTKRLIQVILAENLPYVSMMSFECEGRGANVLIDNYEAVVQIMELLDDGHNRSYCFIAGHKDNFDSMNRQITAEYTYSKFTGKKDFSSRLYYADFMPEPAYQITRHLLSTTDYNTFVCFNDYMAMGVYRACSEASLVIGEDIAVVGFDNVDVLRYVTPSITTINFDAKNYAFIVVRELLKAISNECYSNTEYIPTQLVVNKSHKLKKGRYNR